MVVARLEAAGGHLLPELCVYVRTKYQVVCSVEDDFRTIIYIEPIGLITMVLITVLAAALMWRWNGTS